MSNQVSKMNYVKAKHLNLCNKYCAPKDPPQQVIEMSSRREHFNGGSNQFDCFAYYILLAALYLNVNFINPPNLFL